jgi:hypothetical protein
MQCVKVKKKDYHDKLSIFFLLHAFVCITFVVVFVTGPKSLKFLHRSRLSVIGDEQWQQKHEYR